MAVAAHPFVAMAVLFYLVSCAMSRGSPPIAIVVGCLELFIVPRRTDVMGFVSRSRVGSASSVRKASTRPASPDGPLTFELPLQASGAQLVALEICR